MASPEDGQILQRDEPEHLRRQIAELIKQQCELQERKRQAQHDKEALQERMDNMVREMEMKLNFWYTERQDLQDKVEMLKKHAYSLMERSRGVEESVQKEIRRAREAWVEEHQGLNSSVARLKEEKHQVELKERQALREQENLQAIVNMNMAEVKMNLKFYQEERQLLLKEITVLTHEKYEAEQNTSQVMQENNDLLDEINKLGLTQKPKKDCLPEAQKQTAALNELKSVEEEREREREATGINQTLQAEKEKLQETVRLNKLAMKDLVEKLEIGYLRERALQEQLQGKARVRFVRRPFNKRGGDRGGERGGDRGGKSTAKR